MQITAVEFFFVRSCFAPVLVLVHGARLVDPLYVVVFVFANVGLDEGILSMSFVQAMQGWNTLSERLVQPIDMPFFSGQVLGPDVALHFRTETDLNI